MATSPLVLFVIICFSIAVSTAVGRGSNRYSTTTTMRTMMTDEHTPPASTGYSITTVTYPKESTTTTMKTTYPVRPTAYPSTTAQSTIRTVMTTTAKQCQGDWKPCRRSSHCCSGFCTRPPWGCSVCIPTPPHKKNSLVEDDGNN